MIKRDHIVEQTAIGHRLLCGQKIAAPNGINLLYVFEIKQRANWCKTCRMLFNANHAMYGREL